MRVLNARQDKEESQIVARAGMRGAITVATDMAGRGTDIHLEPDVIALGGLHVLAAEPHESRRVDRQLFGRCGRQGDPGSYERYVSLDDELFNRFAVKLTERITQRWSRTASPPPTWIIERLCTHAQRVAERKRREQRRRLLGHDHQKGARLAFAGHEARLRAPSRKRSKKEVLT